MNIKKCFLFFCMLSLFIPTLTVFAEEENTTESNQENKTQDAVSLIPNAKAGILIEAGSGQILFEKNKDEKLAVASMTKMVAQILILEQIEQGKLKWTDKIKASSNASGMGGSQIFLSTGEELTVEEMMKGISMASANDATVAMAEHISGSEIAFVKKMNEKVKSLGLQNTQFKNCTGLDEDGHYSSAYDMAMIAQELLRHEEILRFSSQYEDYLRKDTANQFWLVNTNRLIRFYEGADGLKTGHTDAALYCLAATAKKNNMRLIAIVLGEENSKTRNSETMEFLDYGFQNYQMQVLKKKENVLKTIPLQKANLKELKLYPKEDIAMLKKTGEQDQKYAYKVKLEPLKLPIQKQQSVGKIELLLDGKKIKEIDLVSKEDAKPLSFLKLLEKVCKQVVGGTM